MKISRHEIKLKPRKRGFHLITAEIESMLTALASFRAGIAHIFIRHTSASLAINENADPTVRDDFEAFFNRLVPESANYFMHTTEGPDDMTSHIKSSLLGSSVSIPIKNGSFDMGTWQGIYLCEHRNYGGSRKLTVTLFGE